jgi:drug/metabolite transporter (DMT)-like permease
MRPLGILGVILIVAGLVVLVLRGFSYTKDRDSVNVGPLKISAEEKGFVPPVAGIVAVAAGLVLVTVGRKRA